MEPTTFYIWIDTKEDYKTIINNIENLLNTKFTNNINLNNNISNLTNSISNLILYKNSNISIMLYSSNNNLSSSEWGNLRNTFYKLLYNIEYYKNFKYYLNTDNDDFFYVKNIKNYLNNYNIELDDFHAIEFISHDNYNLNNDFEFISHSYYFRLKGAKNISLKNNSSHGWCRQLNLFNPVLNEVHAEKKKKICCSFDIKLSEHKLKNIEDYDQICFCFGCLDLNYLLNEKHWLQSNNDANIFHHDKEYIIDSFNKYYKLTEEEYNNNIILNCNFLKKYFI